MIELEKACSIISRGKFVSSENMSENGNYYLLKLVAIKDDGTISKEEKFKCLIENEKNMQYMYGVKNRRYNIS